MVKTAGYKTITVLQIARLVQAVSEEGLSWQGGRVYFSLLEWHAIREAAERTRKRQGRKPGQRLFRREELCGMTGLSERAVKRALVALQSLGLVQLDEVPEVAGNFSTTVQFEALAGGRSARRPVPIPRTLLRSWAKDSNKSDVWTALGHLVRGVTLTRDGVLKTKGRVKATWIGKVFGLSERAVRYSQKKLRADGIFRALPSVHQLQLNRHGMLFEFNFEWKPKVSIVKRDKKVTAFAPLSSGKCTDFAPLTKDRKTSTNQNNQKTPVGNPSGVFERGRTVFPTVVRSDLHRLDRLETLYQQAQSVGWIRGSESAALNFVSAAVRAREARNGDSVKIFFGIVRRGLWHHITQPQEDHARKALCRIRENKPERFRNAQTEFPK